MKLKLHLIVYSIFLTSLLSGQELNCNFSINTNRIQGTNKQVFTTLEATARDFLNNTIWTNNVFEASERIECNIQLDIMEWPSPTEFKAKLTIQSRRPVFNTSYNTVLLNYLDLDVDFHYEEFDAIEFSENTFISNLSSVLTFYAYIIIGLDYDSYAPKAGTPYFQKAEKIMNVAQSSNFSGWRPSEGEKADRHKNRYWLIDNLLDADYQPIRDFTYKYQRLGLDVLAIEGSFDMGRTVILDALDILDEFFKNKPDPYLSLLQVITESKAEEIVDIFSEAPADQKQKVLKLMVAIDPGGGNKYDRLK